MRANTPLLPLLPLRVLQVFLAVSLQLIPRPPLARLHVAGGEVLRS